jgi:hypothetical protein
VARGKSAIETLTVEFDAQGRTRKVAFVQREQDLGWGFGLTPPVITRDLLGVGGSHPLEQNRWGMGLLRHLQYTLNANQDLDAGIHGFEQNDTPTSVGQRTLEWVDRSSSSQRSKP